MAAPTLIYTTVPTPVPPNVTSLGYQAGHIAEFGDLITFAGTNRSLTNVTLVMSDFAKASVYPTYPGAGGPTWSHPLTLNLYNVDNSGANPPQPGTLIATKTVTATIPWRPESDPTCSDPTRWRAGDGNCYSGLAFTVTFDFTGTTVPNSIIYGLAFNTGTYGAAPIGTVGPYDGLNIGLSQVAPTIGTNPNPDSAFLNAADNPGYNDGGAGGTGFFRRDPSVTPTPANTWAPFSGAISFEVADADLSITKTAAPGPYGTGNPLTYTIVVNNAGPTAASGVTVTDTIPAGTTFTSATPSQGSCSGTSTVTCTLGTINSGASATISLTIALPSTPGPVSNTATVTSSSSDANPANNSATSTITVVAAASIPTLSQTALLLLALAVSLIAVIRIRS
jgi:uncharacterized repeat protein (TIGR01451 family)